jgi:3-methyladenine DNA glycosylase AlkD
MPESVAAILQELEPLGKESYRKVMRKHRAHEPIFGVKIEELKKIQKRIKMDYRLALGLYATGNYDAMYLAGLIADDAQMTEADLQRWVAAASPPLATSAVAWVAAGSPYGWKLGLAWTESAEEMTASAGWATLSAIIATTPDEQLDLKVIRKLLLAMPKAIVKAPNDVRYQMNAFVICVGSYVQELFTMAREIGEEIGPVEVDVGETACQVPLIVDYLDKVAAKGNVGKKRKTAKC